MRKIYRPLRETWEIFLMRAHPYGVWVLCQTNYNELIVIKKADFDHWEKLYTKDYKYIAEGKHEAMQSIKKVIKESTC